MGRLVVMLCLMLSACGVANGGPVNEALPAAPNQAGPAGVEPTPRFARPDDESATDETPLYKLVAREYFAALRAMDIEGLRRTLSQRVQNDAGAALKADIDAMREELTRIEIEEAGWTPGENHWVCTFHQTFHFKAGGSDTERDQKIYLVNEKGFWRVEQSPPKTAGNK